MRCCCPDASLWTVTLVMPIVATPKAHDVLVQLTICAYYNIGMIAVMCVEDCGRLSVFLNATSSCECEPVAAGNMLNTISSTV